MLYFNYTHNSFKTAAVDIFQSYHAAGLLTLDSQNEMV